MKKIDLNTPMVDLDGQAPEGSQLLCKILARQLAGQTKGDPLKFWDWAVKLHKCEPLELDSSDEETLTNFVKNDETLFVIAKAQILKRIRE